MLIVGGTVNSSCLDRPPEALGHFANVTLLSTQISSAVGSLAAAGTINRGFLHNPYPHLVANLQLAVHPTDVFFGGRDQSTDMQVESFLREAAFCLRVQLKTAPHPRDMRTQNPQLADTGGADLFTVERDLKCRHGVKWLNPF